MFLEIGLSFDRIPFEGHSIVFVCTKCTPLLGNAEGDLALAAFCGAYSSDLFHALRQHLLAPFLRGVVVGVAAQGIG